MKSINTHSQQFHHNADKYSCQDHLNIYQYLGSPPPSHLSNTNAQDSEDSSESVGIDVDSDDNVSLFSNSSVIQYVYVGHDLLTNDVTHVSVHSLAKVIDSQLFNCMKLKKTQFRHGLEVIKEYAVQGCTELKHVIFLEGILSIEIGAFNGCSSLQHIVIPSSVIHLGQYSFKDYMQLEEVIFYDVFDHGLRNILGETFSRCTSLKTVNIPSLVMDISWSAFNGCDNSSLSLTYPQEIIDFIGGYNIAWWNVCTIQYQVHAYSFIQSRNVITHLRLFEEKSLAHVIDLFS